MESERKVLEKLVSARAAIKHKLKLLKANKYESKKLINETLRPIREPLEKLIELKKEKKKKEKKEETVEEEEEEEEGGEGGEEDADEYVEADETIVEPYLKAYMDKTDDTVDRVYGLKIDSSGGKSIGDARVEFYDDYMSAAGEQYPLTKGFLELICKKRPAAIIEAQEMANYKKLVLQTRLYLNKDGSVKQGGVNNGKFNALIKPIIPTRVGGALPEYKVVKSQVDLVYYDDLNELVERLKLLIAERDAGNDSHTNEILSILEELREAKCIV